MEFMSFAEAIARLRHNIRALATYADVVSVQVTKETGRAVEHALRTSDPVTINRFNEDDGNPVKSEADGHIRYMVIDGIKVWWKLNELRVLPSGETITE